MSTLFAILRVSACVCYGNVTERFSARALNIYSLNMVLCVFFCILFLAFLLFYSRCRNAQEDTKRNAITKE